MKGDILKILHTCEDLTRTSSPNCNLVLDADQSEGVYSWKMTTTAVAGKSKYTFVSALDLSRFTHFRFHIKGDVCTFRFFLHDSATRYNGWDISMPQASFISVSVAKDTPDHASGVELDYTDIVSFEFRVLQDAKTTYMDYIHCYSDVESKIANCIIWSPMYKGVLGTPPVPRPFGWDPNVPYTDWDKRYQLCRIRIRPTDKPYFMKGDDLTIYDDNDVCCFYGRIVKKHDRMTSYIIDAWGWGDELIESIFKNTYSAKRTDEILIGQIDASSKSTQDTSIDQTTITMTYDVKIPTYAYIDLARYMERGVFWRVPGYDGKCFFDKDITDVNLLPLATLVFPASYISNPTVGLTGTDIPFVDVVTTAANTSIVASIGSHKRVLKQLNVGGNDYCRHHFDTNHNSGVIEYYGRITETDKYTITNLYEGATAVLQLYLCNAFINMSYNDGVLGWTNIQAVAIDISYHIKIQWFADNTFDLYVNEVKKVDGGTFTANQVSGINRFLFQTYDTISYLDAFGENWDTNYTVGDNLAQFSESHYCKGVRFIGKKSYNLGVTRAHVWGTVNSKEQVNKISSLTTEEQEKGSFPIFPYIDLSLTNYTEVNQLATALKNIFSTDTLFINWRVSGVGFLQWGYRIRARWNIKSILPTTDDYMITEYIYDAKNDRYLRFIISNNTVFEREFVNIQKQLGRDVVANASMMDSQASESSSDGTVLRQRTIPTLIARAPIVHIVAGAPTVNYDVDNGVEIGDLYVDTTNTRVYMCLSNTDGAADWNQID